MKKATFSNRDYRALSIINNRYNLNDLWQQEATARAEREELRLQALKKHLLEELRETVGKIHEEVRPEKEVNLKHLFKKSLELAAEIYGTERRQKTYVLKYIRGKWQRYDYEIATAYAVILGASRRQYSAEECVLWEQLIPLGDLILDLSDEIAPPKFEPISERHRWWKKRHG